MQYLVAAADSVTEPGKRIGTAALLYTNPNISYNWANIMNITSWMRNHGGFIEHQVDAANIEYFVVWERTYFHEPFS